MAIEITNTSSVTLSDQPEGGGSSQSSLFNDILESGGEIEGMFQQKRKQDKRSFKKSGSNGLKDPTVVLRERLAIYNNTRDQAYHLYLNEEDLSFSGVLMFQYHNGYQMLSENIKVGNMETASGLIPILLSRFLPQYELVATQSEVSNSYIVLTQGGIERELDRAERPMEIALDCSVKGLSSPTFTLKTSTSLLLQLPTTPQHVRNKLSSSSLATSSHSSLGHNSSEGSESPRIIEAKSIEDDSMYSYSAPSYSYLTHPPTRNSNTGNSNRSLFKSRSHANTRHKALEQTHSKLSDTSLNSPVGTPTLLVPDAQLQKSGGRNKSKVGNFMEGVARSFKSKRKARPTSIYPEGVVTLRDTKKSNQPGSPAMTERRFSMPTVFHIHYSNAKNSQLYKSVLVSENSLTLEVIKQALERYGMKFADPSEFSLYEVIGRWEAVAMDSMETGLEQSLGALMTPLSPAGNSLESKKIAVPAFEEFVVYYTRELSHNEQPYSVQFFHQAPDGYTRRFELRSKCDDEFEDGSKDLPVPRTPVFGMTSHKAKSDSHGENVKFTISSPTAKDKDKPPMSFTTSSFLECSSPDSGLELQKASVKSTDKTNIFPTTAVGTVPYLLNLQLKYTEKESFVYQLFEDKIAFTACVDTIDALQDHLQISLHVPPVDQNQVLCYMYRKKDSYHVRSDTANVSVNGILIAASTEIHHGDLIQIGLSHLFMFQDFRKVNQSAAPTTADWPYRWYPAKTAGMSTCDPAVTEAKNSNVPFEMVRIDTASQSDLHQPATSAKVVYISSSKEDHRSDAISRNPPSLPTVKEVEPSEEEDHDSTKLTARPRSESSSPRVRSYSESRISRIKSNQQHQKKSTSSFLRQQRNAVHTASTIPINHKILFSFVSSEEDTLINLLITWLQPKSVSFPLAPAYVLAMCLEYSLKYDGAENASRFARKAVVSMQQVVSEITSKLVSWQPSDIPKKSLLADIQPFLYSILFWFSNCLEVYNFLLTQDDLNLVMPGGDKEDENALTSLEHMLHQLFQQVFYPISKILFSVLPMMLEEAQYDSSDSRNSCVCQAIECLKEVLDMMLELHVHTEMIAHLFANLFFFLNGAMFNALIDQGLERKLFQYSRGSRLKRTLDTLERWAGRVGFRDIVLQFLGTFFSAIDLVAITPEELVTLSWDTLREEFPCLHPAQLHFILSHYILPKSIEGCVVSWTPSTQDLQQATNKDMLHESFESHPDFHLPIGGYSLDLACQSQEDLLIQDFVDFLQEKLTKCKNEQHPPKPINVVASGSSVKRKPSKPSLDVAEIVRESPDFTKSFHKFKSSSKTKGPHYSHKALHRKKVEHSEGPAELRGRVQSIVEPLLLGAPEKLLIAAIAAAQENDEEGSSSLDEEEIERWARENFPADSPIISLQRGHKGFGFSLEERMTKDNKGLFITMDDDEVAELQTGDEVLAVDNLIVSDTDCRTIQKYIKEAEEEITIVLAPKTQ